MAISGINDYSSLFQNYKVPSIPSVSMDDVRRQDEQKRAEELESLVAHEPAKVVEVTPRKDAMLEDISITFNKQDSFDYIGQDSDINDLDMRKAISDMQKDQALQQYQYFVGSARYTSDDGMVVSK